MQHVNRMYTAVMQVNSTRGFAARQLHVRQYAYLERPWPSSALR
jgi:hypothetical protein